MQPRQRIETIRVPLTCIDDNNGSTAWSRNRSKTSFTIRKCRRTETSEKTRLRQRRPSRSGFLKGHIKPKVNFLDATKIDDQVYKRLKESAEKFAKLKKIHLEYSQNENNIIQLNEIINCLNSQIGGEFTKINLQTTRFDPDIKQLKLTYDRLIPESLSMISIEIEPTLNLRKEFGDVVRRFLTHICQENGINEIRDTPIYESLLSEKEYYESEMEGDRTDEEQDFDYWFLKDYENPDGQAYTTFKEIYDSLKEKPFSFEEIINLETQNKTEEAYKSLMIKGEEFIKGYVPISWMGGLPDQAEEEEASTIIEDTINLTYSIHDDLYEQFYEWINCGYSCTGISQGVVNSTELTPEMTDEDFDEYPDRLIKYLIEIVELTDSIS